MEKGVNIEDSALKDAIIENLNSTRVIQITNGNLTIGDMFDLRYLNLVSLDEEKTHGWVDLLSDPDDLALEDIVISFPKSINSLNGLQYAKNLLVLSIDGYPIQDLSAISSLKSLRGLFLNTGQWIEPEAFASVDLYYLQIHGLINQETINAASWIPNLQSLYIGFYSSNEISLEEFWSASENPITNLSPLTKLQYLNILTLDSLNIEDISPLESIINLISLNMSSNLISDITPIGSLANLQNLWLYNNLITDITPLKNLRNLIDLNLELNNIYNIEEIVVLDSLQELYIDVATYSSKKNELSELKYKGCVVYATIQPPEIYGYNSDDIVNIANNDIEQGIRNNLALVEAEPDENITIDDMFNLETLIILHDGEDFDENPLNWHLNELNQFEIIYTNDTFDLEFLEYARNLKILYISNYDFSDISVISSLGQLQFIGMPYNSISDLSPLSDLRFLRSAELIGNLITDISPLIDKITTLKSINLTDNLIEDLSPFEFAHYPNDLSISLWGNSITDLSPLSSLINLLELSIGDNNIEDISPLMDLAKLEGLEIDSEQANKFSDILNELKNKGCDITIND